MTNISKLLEISDDISVTVTLADLKEFALAVVNEVMAARQPRVINRIKTEETWQ